MIVNWSAAEERDRRQIDLIDGRSTFSELKLAIFDSVPLGHLAHAVTDESCLPMVRPGEVVIVTDQRGLYPWPGGWFLVETQRGTSYFSGRPCYVREVVITTFHNQTGTWALGVPSGRRGGFPTTMDGPYRDFNVVADRILGEVVGIYRPGPAEP